MHAAADDNRGDGQEGKHQAAGGQEEAQQGGAVGGAVELRHLSCYARVPWSRVEDGAESACVRCDGGKGKEDELLVVVVVVVVLLLLLQTLL